MIGCGCPKCNYSKGEMKIQLWLEKNRIKFTPQKTFDGCKYRGKLRFDFYIPSKNLCIEYDGEQHFIQQGRNRNLNENRKRDDIKNGYCKNKKITLLRISYKKMKCIEDILSKEIVKI
jgi:very-short-patch-repair endonuclease